MDARLIIFRHALVLSRLIRLGKKISSKSRVSENILNSFGSSHQRQVIKNKQYRPDSMASIVAENEIRYSN